MIKLQDILNEQEQFKAKSKETGRVVVYKSKENMDKAIKAGTAEPLDKKKMSVDYCISIIDWVLEQKHRVKEITICP